MSETSVYLNKSTPRYNSEGSLLLTVSTDKKFVRPLLLAPFFLVWTHRNAHLKKRSNETEIKHLLFQRILKRKKFRQTLTRVVKLLLVSESGMGLCLYNFTHSQPWSASQPYALPQGKGSNRRLGQRKLTYKLITSYIALNPLSSHTCLHLPSGLEAG